MGPCLRWDFCLCFYMFASHPPCVYVPPNPGNISNPAVGPNKLANQPTLNNTHAPLLKQWIKTDVEVWKVSRLTSMGCLIKEGHIHFLKHADFIFSNVALSLFQPVYFHWHPCDDWSESATFTLIYQEWHVHFLQKYISLTHKKPSRVGKAIS